MTETPLPRPAPVLRGAGRLRVVVLRSGALGDFVLTTPVLERLRGLAPAVEVTYAGRSSFGALARACGLVDAVVADDAPEFVALFSSSPEADRKVRRAFCGFDVAITYLASRDVAARLVRAGAGEVWAADPLPDPAGATHAADHLLGAAGPLLRTGDARPRLRVPEAIAARGRELLASRGIPERFLLIHPGSGSARKNWRASNFARVAELARARCGLQAVVVVGPVEKEAGDSFREVALAATACLEAPRLTLLAGIASAATCYLGNDSGCSHLAAACGCPTVAVFGPTDASLWAPRGDRVTVLAGAGGDLDDVTPERALAAILDLVPVV